MSNGYVIYEGPSALDGAPIVAIATGFKRASVNTKTGAMIQTWILRADTHPQEAIANGLDSSICGQCPLRGTQGKQRSCYVRVEQAPSAVWKAWRRGAYARLPELRLFEGRVVRFGSYGDPAALQVGVVASIAGAAKGHTGYTHQWRTCDPVFRQYLMASADRMQDRDDAKLRGWRVFRVAGNDVDARLAGEVVCPATRAGATLQCATCMACGGAGRGRRGDVVVPVHGSAPIVANFHRTFRGIAVRAA